VSTVIYSHFQLSYIPITHTYHTQHTTNNTTTAPQHTSFPTTHQTQQHTNHLTAHTYNSTDHHKPQTSALQHTTSHRPDANHHPCYRLPDTHTHTHTHTPEHLLPYTNQPHQACTRNVERTSTIPAHARHTAMHDPRRSTSATSARPTETDRRRQTDGDRPRLRQRRPIPPTGRWLSQHSLASVS